MKGRQVGRYEGRWVGNDGKVGSPVVVVSATARGYVVPALRSSKGCDEWCVEGRVEGRGRRGVIEEKVLEEKC